MLPLLQDGDGDEAAGRWAPRRARRSCCSGGDIDLGRAADPDLLAGRAGAADHLAAGRHQGTRRGAREDNFNLGIYRMQVTGRDTTLMRWLRHRGGAQHHQRWARREARAAAGGGGDRRRSRHHPRRGDAGARHAVGIPVRRPAARQQGRAGRLQDRAAEGAGRGRDRARGPCRARRLRRRRARTATTPAITTRSSSSRCSRVTRDHHAARPDLSLDLHRPAARRALGAGRGAERGVHPAACSSNSRRSSTSGCRPRAAPTASPWCR